MRIADYLRYKADRIEDIEYNLKYRHKPRLLKLFGGFWDIRKRPPKPSKRITFNTMSQALRTIFKEDDIKALCYRQNNLIKWINQGQAKSGKNCRERTLSD